MAGGADTAGGPWRRAFGRLGRDRAAIAASAALLLITAACLLAPVYAGSVAGADPFISNVSGHVMVGGRAVPVLAPETAGLGLGVTPIGPTWHGQYFLGADGQGRDVAARLLYGGRVSLLIAAAATLACLAAGTLLGLLAGLGGGLADLLLGRLLDILWAFPVYLLAISLSVVTVGQGLRLGPLVIPGDSLLLPVAVIGVVYVPYVARPVRARALSLRRSDFVLAATAVGAPWARILRRDVLPHLASTVVVFAPLLFAINLLTESALSFLSVGVQAPAASWGSILQDGEGLIYTRPLVAIAPGAAIVATVLALTVLGDSLRDALDPRASLRGTGA